MKARIPVLGTLVAFLAGLLSIVVAVPAHAADFVPDPTKIPAEVRYKYGYDYYKQSFGGPQSYSVHIDANGNISPSKIGPNTPAVPGQQPLTGKIIEPGKTIVKAPSVYKPTPTFLNGALGLSRFLGTAGVGIGGVGIAPSNVDQIALAKGVSQGCIDNPGACTQAEDEKLMKIGSCNMFTGEYSCSSLGATTPEGSPFGDFIRDVVVPFTTDFWCSITGQCGPKADANGHIAVTLSKGCVTTYGMNYRGQNNITVGRAEFKIITPRPTTMSQQAWWDEACSAAKVASLTGVATPGTMKTECINPSTGKISSGSGQTMGIQQSITTVINADGTNKIGLCPLAGTVLYSVKFYNSQPQSKFDESSTYAGNNYSEWVNPDTSMDIIEDTKITTTWTCQGASGATVNYSRSVSKVSAFVEPVCPEGSTLLNHKVESSSGTGVNTKTLDQGAQDASASAYPLCMPPNPGCAMSVQIDGQTCTATRTECQTWPAVNGSTPSRVQCKWGTYTVATSDCLSMLPNAYKSEVGTIFDPKSQTWTAIDTYGNPIPSNPQPWNPTNPTPVPGTSPGTGTNTPTDPGTGTPGLPGPVTIPNTDGSNCWPGGTAAFNPLEWVLAPVKCALQWAFVPTQPVAQAQMTRVQTSLNKIPVTASIGTLTNTLTAFGGSAGGGAGCMGPAFQFDFNEVHETVYPFNACVEPVATMARITNAMTTVVVIVLGTFGVVRAFGASAGFNFSMGRGSSE